MKAVMADYFIKLAGPFNDSLRLNTKNLKVMSILIGGIGVLAVIAYPAKEEQKEEFKPVVVETTAIASNSETLEQTHLGGSLKIGASARHSHQGSRNEPRIYAQRPVQRDYGASQIVAMNKSGAEDALPLGSTFAVALKNKILSSDPNSPIIAVVTEDVLWKGEVLIPRHSTLFGNGQADEATERLQVHFHSLVFPEGEQHSINGMALMPDGSSGIPGELHSGAVTKQIGRFAGNFVAGVANGFKDRQTGVGIAIEPGSIKNGLLNGLSQSALDQSRTFSEKLEQQKVYIEVDAGISFLIYLEKEFSP